MPAETLPCPNLRARSRLATSSMTSTRRMASPCRGLGPRLAAGGFVGVNLRLAGGGEILSCRARVQGADFWRQCEYLA